MDMSFPCSGGEARAASRLDYPALLAVLGTGVGEAVASASPCAPTAETRDFPELRLVTILLGRSGWRGATRALGGRFSAAAGDHRP